MRRAPRLRVAVALACALLPEIAGGADIPCRALASARRDAVRRGAEYLEIFFEGEEKRAALGPDAVSIFLELGETATDARLRETALAEARRLAAPLARAYTQPGALDGPAGRENLIGALSLLPDAGPLHLSRKSSLRLSSSVLSRVSGRDPDLAYYGARIDPARLDALDADALFDLLVEAYTVERARLAFPGLPAPALSLGDVLLFARARRYASFGAGDDARATDDFYLASHVAYVLSDYSRSRLEPADLGPILPWLRAQAPHVLAARDTEAAAEIADVLRQTGLSDADPDVCAVTRLLLETQAPDGSWPRADPEDAYDVVHPAWVAVHALRDRVFRPAGAWGARVRALLAGGR